MPNEKRDEWLKANIWGGVVYGQGGHNLTEGMDICKPIQGKRIGNAFYSVKLFEGTEIEGKDVGGYSFTVPSSMVTAVMQNDRVNARLVFPPSWSIRLRKNEKNEQTGEYVQVDSIDISAEELTSAIKKSNEDFEKNKWSYCDIWTGKIYGQEGHSLDEGAEVCKPFVDKDGKNFYSVSLFEETIVANKDLGGYRFTIPAELVKAADTFEVARLAFPPDWKVKLTRSAKDETTGEYSIVDEIEIPGRELSQGIADERSGYAEDNKWIYINTWAGQIRGSEGHTLKEGTEICKPIIGANDKPFYSVTLFENTVIDTQDEKGIGVGSYEFTLPSGMVKLSDNEKAATLCMPSDWNVQLIRQIPDPITGNYREIDRIQVSPQELKVGIDAARKEYATVLAAAKKDYLANIRDEVEDKAPTTAKSGLKSSDVPAHNEKNPTPSEAVSKAQASITEKRNEPTQTHTKTA